MSKCELCGKDTNWIEMVDIPRNPDNQYSKRIRLDLCYYCAWIIKRKTFVKKRRIRKAIKKMHPFYKGLVKDLDFYPCSDCALIERTKIRQRKKDVKEFLNALEGFFNYEGAEDYEYMHELVERYEKEKPKPLTDRDLWKKIKETFKVSDLTTQVIYDFIQDILTRKQDI